MTLREFLELVGDSPVRITRSVGEEQFVEIDLTLNGQIIPIGLGFGLPPTLVDPEPSFTVVK